MKKKIIQIMSNALSKEELELYESYLEEKGVEEISSFASLEDPGSILRHSFIWENTTMGHDYWEKIYIRLRNNS